MRFENIPWLSVVGMGLLAWVLLRMNLRRRRSASDVNEDLEYVQKAAGPARATTLAEATPESARVQIAMFDLQRDLLAELDSRAATVRSLLNQVDERIATLQRMQLFASEGVPANSASEPPRWLDEAVTLSKSGWPTDQIARYLAVPLGDVELSLSLRSSK